MEQQRKNKERVLQYFNALSGKVKTFEELSLFTNDRKLIDHILFFDAAFPGYEIYADELTAEGNRVVLRARIKGRVSMTRGDSSSRTAHSSYGYVPSGTVSVASHSNSTAACPS